MKNVYMIFLLLFYLALPAWAGPALSWQFKPSLRYAGEWAGGYAGNTLRLGYALGIGDLQLIPGWYYGGESYGGEMGISLYAHLPGWLPGNFSHGPYTSMDVGAGMFRPHMVFAWAWEAGWQLNYQLRRVWLTIRIGLRYHNAPWYSQNISPLNSLDVPLTLGIVWGR